MPVCWVSHKHLPAGPKLFEEMIYDSITPHIRYCRGCLGWPILKRLLIAGQRWRLPKVLAYPSRVFRASSARPVGRRPDSALRWPSAAPCEMSSDKLGDDADAEEQRR